MSKHTLFPQSPALARCAEIQARFTRFKTDNLSILPAVKSFNLKLLTPVCQCCQERPVVFGLADESGNALPVKQGGFCRECAPIQGPEDEQGSDTTPASLEAVESAATIEEMIAALDARAAASAEYAKAAAQAKSLRSSVRFYDQQLRSTDCYMSAIQFGKIRDLLNGQRAQLAAIEAAYPFI